MELLDNEEFDDEFDPIEEDEWDDEDWDDWPSYDEDFGTDEE